MKRIILLFAITIASTLLYGQEYTITGLIRLFDSEERCHELLVDNGYEYNKEAKCWSYNDDIIYFNRYPDGEKQLVYEFFNKHLFENLTQQLSLLKYVKLPDKVEGRDVYLNDKNIISLSSRMIDYEGMEVKRFLCAVERANTVVKALEGIIKSGKSEYELLNYKGIEFRKKKGWVIDTTTVEGRLGIICSNEAEGFVFAVEAVPVGVANIDSSKIEATAVKLLEITKEKGALITSTYRSDFSEHSGGYVFDFTQKVNDTESINGRNFIFSKGNYLVIIKMLATKKDMFDTVFKEIEKSFKINCD